MYKAGVVDGVAGLSGKGSLPRIASGRDIGNIGAGFMAGSNGISLNDARLGFDALQSYQQGTLATEGQKTQLSEKAGYNLGVGVWSKANSWQALFINDNTVGLH